MTKLQKKAISLITISAMFLNMSVPAFAGTTLEITGNGSDSDSKVELNTTQTTNVVQNNEADIDNDVNVNASTGGNDANRNTGGNVEVSTGNATVGVSVENHANQNVADIEGCDCDGGDTDVLIEGNGDNSRNRVNLNDSNNTLVVQDNEADVDNDINADASTGRNEANRNTGGNVTVSTGNATAVTGIINQLNSNAVRVGGHGESGGSLSARIIGNGADSFNKLDLGLTNNLNVVQANEADVDNDVDSSAKTGYNDANRNTGGDVVIDTGKADMLVGIDNMANFNIADVNCDCFLEDIMAKVSENGDNSDNRILADLGDNLGIFQGNCSDEGSQGVSDFGRRHRGSDCEIDNDVDGSAKTGYNDADRNTGESDSDPSITTGDAEGTVLIENDANVNTVGSLDSDHGEDHDDEEEGNGFSFEFYFNFFGA